MTIFHVFHQSFSQLTSFKFNLKIKSVNRPEIPQASTNLNPQVSQPTVIYRG